MWKKYLGFGDVCEEVNQDLRVKRVKRNVGLGVKMSPMYERIDRGVWLTIPGDWTFFNNIIFYYIISR